MNTSKKPSIQTIVNAIRANNGYLGKAADTLKVNRMTLYNWISKDNDLQIAVNMQNEANIDFVESQHRKRIKGYTETLKTITTRADGKREVTEREVSYPPAEASIIFYLKTKGRQRGYSQNIDYDDGNKKEFDEEERETRIAALEQKLLDNE